jgi:hypothetical protein
VGGAKTIREPFRNGGYAEAGAVRTPSSHALTMKYIKAMGLEQILSARVADDARDAVAPCPRLPARLSSPSTPASRTTTPLGSFDCATLMGLKRLEILILIHFLIDASMALAP